MKIHKIENLKFNSYKYRKKILNLSQNVGALHIGGSFSSTDIVNVIYNYFKKKNDKFILSKGHCGILQYVVLNDLKIVSDSLLKSYCQKDSYLGVHPDFLNPGIEASTGSLGHGLGIAAGLALANRKKNIFVVMSDGELMEGSTWEFALTISSLKLKNIFLFIDFNGLQSSTWAKDTHPTLMPIDKKFQSFGWEAKACDGHNFSSIIQNFNKRKKIKPFVMICKTTKGHPIPFMKNIPAWHYRSPNKEEYKTAIKFLKQYYNNKTKINKNNEK
jgi:transketolase